MTYITYWNLRNSVKVKKSKKGNDLVSVHCGVH